MRRMLLISPFLGLLGMCSGCGICQPRQPAVVAQPAYVVPPPPTPIVPGPPVVQQSGAVIGQPQGIVAVPPPPGAAFMQPQPAPAPSLSRSPEPQSQAQWRSVEPYGNPPKIEAEPPNRPRVQLYAPEPIEKTTEEPPLQKESGPRMLPPIPRFAATTDERIFTGLRPRLNGLDWLRDNGVKSVIYLREPGQDDSSDRTQIEKRNMKYVSFEISPQTLTKARADEFIRLVRQGAEQRVFVYDDNGALAGSMWYLFLRWGVPLDDGAAQINARELGLDANRDGLHRDMWLAVQKLVSENNR